MVALDAIKARLAPLVEHLWHSEQSNRAQTDLLTLPSQVRSDLHSVITEGIWGSDASLIELISVTSLSNATDALNQLHKSALSCLHRIHSSSLRAQNISESIEKYLNLAAHGSLGNATWWNNLKTEVVGVTEQIDEKRPREFEAKLGGKEAKLETVMVVEGEEDEKRSGEREAPLMFIDSKSNQYVLSHPSGIKSLAAHSEDPAFIRDIIVILLVALVLGFAVERTGLPGFFGHILTGIMLGPSGLNIISNVVQVSSLGQIGAYLLLLELGSEFSLTKVKKFAGITIFGTLLFTLLFSLGWGVFGRFVLGSSFQEASFIGLMLSFASTAVSIKCIRQAGEEPRAAIVFNVLNIESIVTGILLMQDALFSTVISMLPVLAHSREGSSVAVIGSLVLFAAKCALCASLTGASLWLMKRHANRDQHELFLLIIGLASICFCSHIGISGEFGAFFTGLSYSLFSESTLKASREDLELEGEHSTGSPLIQTLSFVFCTLFFASIGLFVDLSFIRAEFLVLIAAACMAIGAKLAIMYALASGPFKMTRRQSMLISLNLSQVSELSMALGSKGRRLGIISREVYLLVVGTTMICLVVVPFLWKLVIRSMDMYTPASPRDSPSMTEA